LEEAGRQPGPARARAGPGWRPASSKVFQAAQCGHWPCHLALLAPQALQT